MISKKSLRLVLRFLFFTTIFMVLCAFQTSFWPFMIPLLPAPSLWLMVIVYVAVKWPPPASILYIYFLGLIMTQYSFIPLKMAWVSLLVLYTFIWLFKNRIHSGSLFFYSILSAASSLAFSFTFIIVSYLLEKNPTSLLILHRLIDAGLLFILGFPLFAFMSKIDDFFQIDDPWNTTRKSTTSPNYDSEF